MRKYKINKPIAALYTALATGAASIGGTFAWQEIEENRQHAELWAEINTLTPATQALEDSGILPPEPVKYGFESVARRINERNGIAPPVWSAKKYLDSALKNPDDTHAVCLALEEMTLMNKFYLRSGGTDSDAAENPRPVTITPEYRELVENRSDAEKALCLGW